MSHVRSLYDSIISSTILVISNYAFSAAAFSLYRSILIKRGEKSILPDLTHTQTFSGNS